MAQTLLLGLGGTGSRIVNHVAKELKDRNIRINDGNICCAVLDTNDNDRKLLKATGVGIPVIPTSKDRKIEDYMKMYSNRGVRSWMPESCALNKESMLDGASQMRPKSRLAFFDILQDNTIRQLETQIDKMFIDREEAKIRVMIVSSLAGGTGSGMFIQTALWLRKYFSMRRCAVTIRGIFVLPDVFVRTIDDIRTDESEKQSLYANAYGAVRELNAISKIDSGKLIPLLPVTIDGLFDSDRPYGKPVYDYSFFMDDITESGSNVDSIEKYEKIAARLVYMQVFAPLKDNLNSEEDNLFKRFQKSPEPVFGSCGTAKALYPTADIVRYCALRAAQDSLSTGWRKIDEEIKVKQKKEAEKERKGIVLTSRINPRAEYIRSFEAKIAKRGAQIGSDQLFFNISNHIINEERVVGEDGNTQLIPTNKVDDFLDKIENLITTHIDTNDVGNLSKINLGKLWAEQTSDTKANLVTLINKKVKDVDRFLQEVDDNAEHMAEEILELVCPNDVGDVNHQNEASVMGLFTKPDENEELYFVHPIAARYLLYKLTERLDNIKKNIVLASLRKSAEQGYGDGKPRISFDNSKTGKVENSALEYLDSRAFLQNEAKFIKEFKIRYAQHNAGQHELCRKYAIESLKYKLAILLTQRVEGLINVVEDFFADLVKVSNSLEDAVAENIRKNAEAGEKVIYICASKEEKEALYTGLGFKSSENDTNINDIITRALYYSFCAKDNADAENNKNYVGKSVEVTFFNEVLASYSKLIMEKHGSEVDLDIYGAICKSSDIQAASEGVEEESDRLSFDSETGEAVETDAKHQRHIDAMSDMKERLFRMASPFLISNDELPEDSDEYSDGSDYDENDTFTPIKKRKTFWGFHPVVAEKCRELGTILGGNISTQKNEAYAKNELDCYRAVYGIQAAYIDKFNEKNNGQYYKSYREVVRKMVKDVDAGDEEALINTPHLDKTWHLFLPYVTPERQMEEDTNFYRNLWIAIAFGMITLGNNGKYQITRERKLATGGSYPKTEEIRYNGEPVGKVDIAKLILALKLDGTFMVDVAKYVKEFENELGTLETYEGTSFFRGVSGKSDLNPVTVIVRYNNLPKHNEDITAMLVEGLEKLLTEIVATKYEVNETDKVKAKVIELCGRIYNASELKDKNIERIAHWGIKKD